MSEIQALATQAETEIKPVVERARAVAAAVKDDVTYNEAAQFLLGVKKTRNRVDEIFGPFVSRLHKAWKESLTDVKKYTEPLDVAERTVKAAIVAYHTEQENIRVAEQRRLEAENRKREEEARLAQAIAMEQEGDKGGAEKVLDAPIVTAPVVLPATPKVAGISYREDWKFEVSSLAKLVAWVAAHPEMVELLMPNEKAIRGIVNAQKGECRIDGLRVYPVKTPVAGGFR